VTASVLAARPAPGSPPVTPLPLPAALVGRRYVVDAVDGDDLLARRLASCGLWPGAVLEALGRAPFGDPLLVRVHGFRLALRVREAARVHVVEARA
jgi:ferrous iron transport protein A